LKPGHIFIVVISFILAPALSAAQDWETNKKNFISNLSYLRSQFMIKDSIEIMAFDQLIHKINAYNATDDEKEGFLGLMAAAVNYEQSYKSFIKEQKRINRKNPLRDKLNEADYDIAAKNANLLSLEMISKTYPYNLVLNEDLFQELKYYDIKKGESIADIGAGDGRLSRNIFLLDQSNMIYINELETFFVTCIQNSIERLGQYFDIDRIKVIKGHKKKTNLPEKVDKIIIRNTFHHFQYREEMMRSVHESLNDKGVLFILETPKEKGETGCDVQLTTEEIIAAIENSLFKIVDRKNLGEEDIIFKLVKR